MRERSSGRSTGLDAAVYDGEIRVQFPALADRTIRLLCLFVEELPRGTPLLLGLRDFIDVFRITIDGEYAPDVPAGSLVLAPLEESHG